MKAGATVFLAWSAWRFRSWRWLFVSSSLGAAAFFLASDKRSNQVRNFFGRKHTDSQSSGNSPKEEESHSGQQSGQGTIHEISEENIITAGKKAMRSIAESASKDNQTETSQESKDEADEDQEAKPELQCLVHCGFLAAYSSVRDQILALIQSVASSDEASSVSKSTMYSTESLSSNSENSTKSDDSKDSWTVTFTGHSLGGALATLAALDVGYRRKDIGVGVKMYNFGSPRVGNRRFAEIFDDLVPDAWRIVNMNDGVPGIPRPFMGYHHVGHYVGIDEKGNIKIKHSSSLPFEGTSMDDIAPAIRQAMNEAVSSAIPSFFRSEQEGSKDDDEGSKKSAGEQGSRLSDTISQKLSDMDSEASQEELGISLSNLDELLASEKESLAMLFTAEALKHHMEQEYFSGEKEDDA